MLRASKTILYCLLSLSYNLKKGCQCLIMRTVKSHKAALYGAYSHAKTLEIGD